MPDSALIVGVVLGILLIVYLVRLYNHLVPLRNNVDLAWSKCQLVLAQLHREVPKLHRVLAAHAGFEKETIRQIREARTMNLRALMEAFPNLKADDSFLTLETRISALEDHLRELRKSYADAVNQFNTEVQRIPVVLFAPLMGFRAMSPLDLASSDELSATDRKLVREGEGMMRGIEVFSLAGDEHRLGLPESTGEASGAFGARSHVWPAEREAVETSTAGARTCANCGSVLALSAKFCAKCGAAWRTTVPAGDPRKCSACGTENSSAAKFCKECGQAV